MIPLGGRGRTIPHTPKVYRTVKERVGFNPDQGVAGFKGMRSTTRGSSDPTLAEWLHNCYPMNPFVGGEIVPRPGRQPYPSLDDDTVRHQIIPGNTAKLTGIIQLLTEAPLGLRTMVAIVGGKFYANSVVGSGTGAWVEAVNAAAFSGVGITLSAGARYRAVMFNEKLVVVGPTHAFTWNGTLNGGLVNLTAAGNTFAEGVAPTVYAAKLFFLKSDGRTIIWSEEGDETSGYEGTNNAWDLRQTSQEDIKAILGQNEAFYFIRRDSIGAFYGGSSEAFQTTTTLDAIDPTIGTDVSDNFIPAKDAIWFTDNEGRPNYFLRGSSQVVPVWREIERAFTPHLPDGTGYDQLAAPNRETAAFLDYGQFIPAIYVRTFDMVFFAYRHFASPTTPLTAFDVLLGFNATTKKLQTVWQFPTGIMAMTEIYDFYYGTGQTALVIADNYGYTYSLNPSHLMSVNHPDTWGLDRTDVDGTEGEGLENRREVDCSVIGPRHFETSDTELRAIRLDIDYIGFEPDYELTVRWATPQAMIAGEGVRLWETRDENEGGNAFSQPSMTIPLEGDGSGVVAPGHGVVGLDELGRWFAFGFSWQGSSRMRLLGWQVEAAVEGRQREAY